jgi:hypothetical protein
MLLLQIGTKGFYKNNELFHINHFLLAHHNKIKNLFGPPCHHPPLPKLE